MQVALKPRCGPIPLGRTTPRMQGANLMTSDITASIRRAIRRISTPNRSAVHFHIDGDGLAFACHSDRCDASVLTLSEASLTETGARRRVR